MKKIAIAFAAVLVWTACGVKNESAGTAVREKPYMDTLITVARRAYDRGLTDGAGGDISVRVPGTDRFIIKATKQSYGDLNEGRLSVVDLDMHVVGGNPKPSDETEIHAAVYKHRRDIGAILHMHAPYATAWGVCGKPIPAMTQQSVSLLKGMVLIPYHPVGSKQLVASVASAYENPDTKVVMMENHGTFIVARDLWELLYRSETVEATAQTAFLARAIGNPKSFAPAP